AAWPCATLVTELAYLYFRLCADHHARQGRRGIAQCAAQTLASAVPRQSWRPAQRAFVRPGCCRHPDARRPDPVSAGAADDPYRYRLGADCAGGDFTAALAGKAGRVPCTSSVAPGAGAASCLRDAVAGTTLQYTRYAGAGNLAECHRLGRRSTGLPLDAAMARHGGVAGVFTVCLHDCDDRRGAELHAWRARRRGSHDDRLADMER